MLDVYVEVVHSAHDPSRLVHEPAGVGVSDQHVPSLKLLRHRPDPLDVGVRVATHFQLKLAVALRPVTCDPFRHGLRRRLGNRPVQREVFAIATAEQRTYG